MTSIELKIPTPAPSTTIGLVLSDRSLRSPMAGALLQAVETADFEARFHEALRAS
jgi:hypothetical protein